MSKVRALTTREDVSRVGELLEKHYSNQYKQVWTLAVNVGLRIGDVLSITMHDARRALFRGNIEIKEEKTGKINQLDINFKVKEIINERLETNAGDTWLFQSHSNNAKALIKPLSRQSVYKAFRGVGDIIGIKLGTHSARKSRARLMYENGYSMQMIQGILNHASEYETKAYIDITHEEKQKSYSEFVL